MSVGDKQMKSKSDTPPFLPLVVGNSYITREGQEVTVRFFQLGSFYYTRNNTQAGGIHDIGFYRVDEAGKVYTGVEAYKEHDYDIVAEKLDLQQYTGLGQTDKILPGAAIYIEQSIVSKATDFSNRLEIRDGRVSLETLDFTIHKLLKEEVKETEEANHSLYYGTVSNKCDTCADAAAVELVDGFADVAFVAINGIYKTLRFLGHAHDVAQKKTEECLQEVCRSNLTKINEHGMVVLSEEGKVMKPENYEAPKLSNIVRRKYD